VAVPVLSLVLALSILIITKTPPGRIFKRLREAYSYLFGAQLPDSNSEDSDSKISPLDAENDVEKAVGTGGSMPWWRRNSSGREEDPEYAGAGAEIDDLLGGSGDSRDRAFDTALEEEHPTDVLAT